MATRPRARACRFHKTLGLMLYLLRVYFDLVFTSCREGVAQSVSIPETRIWQKFGGDWKCVHSHRSAGGANPPKSPDNPSDQ